MRTVAVVVLAVAFAGFLARAATTYELIGRLVPGAPAEVSLFGATSPFFAQSSAGKNGRFRVAGLAPSEYIVALHIPGKGEIRQTVDVGPGTADPKRRVYLSIPTSDPALFSNETEPSRATVSTLELSIPEQARREYADAQKSLSRREIAAAIKHLERAVAIAPQFSNAWNNLGTIAYQTRQYARADECFRSALKHNPDAYEPAVNLGGVLMNEGRPDEALTYNRLAAGSRPHDALADSQLGLNYFILGKLDDAMKYLELAKHIDPGHFSHPQLTLARIHLARHELAAAIAELRDFLRLHPDAHESANVREQLLELETATGRAPAMPR